MPTYSAESVSNESKRSARIYSDLDLDFQMNPVTKDVPFLKDVEAVYAESKKTKLEKVMSTNLKTIAPDATLNSLVDLMVSSNLKRIPVVDGDKLVGIIARKDLIRAFNKA